VLLGLLRAADHHGGGCEPVGHQRGADPRAAPPHLLFDQAAREVVEVWATIGIRYVDVHQAHFPGLLDYLLRPGAVPVVIPGDGSDLLLGEVVREFAKVLLLVGQREVNH
jgi:hypothetical protein